MGQPLVSFVLATHNRRDVTERTVTELSRLPLNGIDREIIAVDNASTDGTPTMLAGRNDVRLIALRQNAGSCAKAWGVDAARGEYIVFLDDDSYPQPGTVEQMVAHFRAEPTLGAAGGTIHLPTGTEECSALPPVFVGCGVGLRRTALREVGGLDRTFFMQAEEYDLAFRLLRFGWGVQVFGDMPFTHLKTPFARQHERTTYFDVRNNLRVIGRYLPREWADVYQAEWLQRYEWLAEANGFQRAFLRGCRDGRRKAILERMAYKVHRLTLPVLERVFNWRRVRQEMEQLSERGVRRIVLGDLGKNIYAFYRGAVAAGLVIVAVADDRFVSLGGRRYRGIPIVPRHAVANWSHDAVVISNTSYVHAAAAAGELATISSAPVHNWFPPPAMASSQGFSQPPALSA
jgi:hypothetical protein